MNLQSTLYDHCKYHYANTTTQLKGGMNPIDNYDPSVIDLFPSVVAARSTALVCTAGFDLNSALYFWKESVYIWIYGIVSKYPRQKNYVLPLHEK